MTEKQPWVTGFCGVGNHPYCPAFIKQGIHQTVLLCTCECHASQIITTPGTSNDVRTYEQANVTANDGFTTFTVTHASWVALWTPQLDPLVYRVHEAMVATLRKLLAPTAIGGTS